MSAEERSGWRDQRLSGQHRKWGFDCPAVDIDFLLIEYDLSEPMALIDYKHEQNADWPPTRDANARAFARLGDKAKVPAFYCRYAADLTWYEPVPMNDMGLVWVPEPVRLTEMQWVELLYRMRARVVPSGVRTTIEQAAA